MPLIKQENLQDYMAKTFLLGDFLQKPYKRFFILFLVLLCLIVGELLKFFFNWGNLKCTLVVVVGLQGVLVILFLFVKKNFYFFFGDLRRFKVDLSKKKNSSDDNKKNLLTASNRLPRIKLYKRDLILGSVFKFSLLKKTRNTNKLVLIQTRSVFESIKVVADSLTHN
jgi:hypothetical protein